jgi:hypothetical protein
VVAQPDDGTVPSAARRRIECLATWSPALIATKRAAGRSETAAESADGQPPGTHADGTKYPATPL